MELQNVTLSLPKILLKKAKASGALSEKSLSELLRESLEKKVKETAVYGKAKNRQLKTLKKGINLGTNGSIAFSREELYER
jgi:hypothetical protein